MPSFAFELQRERTAGWPSEDEVLEGVRLNLGCGKVILPTDEGWVNVDHLALEGVDVVADLFTFPWPFEDNYADYMIASHLIEHIPHQVKMRKRITESSSVGNSVGGVSATRTRTVEEDHPLDGFFAFFAEVYRVLKPDGIICTIAPGGRSTLALQDPTHTRSIVESTFSYLGPAESATFDYGLPFSFEAIGGAKLYAYDNMPPIESPEAQFAMRHFWDAIHTIRCDLRAIKAKP